MNGVGHPMHHSHHHPGAHLHHAMHHHDGSPGDEMSRGFGSPGGRSGLGAAGATSSPNEHLYSSLYGREMELMRKMFKANNEKMDPTDVGSSYHGGSMRGVPPGGNFAPYSSPIFGSSAAKYFEGLSAGDQAKFAMSGGSVGTGGGVSRSDLFEHSVHSSNSGSNAANKSQALMGGMLKPTFDEKHFGLNFGNNNNNNNNNIMNPNHNLNESSLPSNNNNLIHNNHKYGGFASAQMTSPTSTDSSGGAMAPGTTTTNTNSSGLAGMHSHNHSQNHSAMMMGGDQYTGHNMHSGSFHGLGVDKEMVSPKLGGLADFEARKSVDDAKTLAKLSAKLDDHFLDDELKSRISQQLAASMMGSSHHSNNNNNNSHIGNHINNSTSNDDDEDDEFTSL